MIKLEVEEYCHSCAGFEADVTGPITTVTTDGELCFGDTIVRCAYRNRCRNIKRYLERQTTSSSEKEYKPNIK